MLMHHLMSVAAGGRSLFHKSDAAIVAPGAPFALTIGVERFALGFECRLSDLGLGLL
jgi:hypothetical protein